MSPIRRLALSPVRRITYDWSPVTEPGPEAGDVLESISTRTHEPTGTAYRILSVNDVRTRRPLPGIRRLRLAVVRMFEPPADDDRRWSIRWYRRGEWPS